MAGLVVDGADLVESLAGLAEVEQDVGLLPGGEGQERAVFGFAGGGGRELEPVPRRGEVAHVDRLPSGECCRVGQDQGEPLADGRA